MTKRILALMLCVSTPCWSAIAFVQCVNQYPYTTGAAITTTAGNLLIAATSSGITSRNDTCSDGHNTYVHAANIGTTVNTATMGLDMSYALSIAGGAETVTCGATGDDMGITVCEFSGVTAFDISSKTVSGAGATTTPTSLAFTTALTELVVLYYANGTSGGEATEGTGYSINANRSTNHFDALEYKVDVAAGSQTPFVTITSDNHWVMATLAFSGAAAASASGRISTTTGTGRVSTTAGTGRIIAK